MKIISSFKDYYDYLMGIYGIDEKIIYDRSTDVIYRGKRERETLYKFEKNDHRIKRFFYIAFCDTLHKGYFDGKSFYFNTDAVKEISGPISKGKWKWYSWIDREEKWPIKTNLNIKCSCPIVLIEGIPPDKRQDFICPGFDTAEIHLNVKLSEWGFQSVITPEEAYLKLSTWLSQESIIINKQSDKDKIISHGFDIKNSFRH